jgi:ElaA protein
VTPPAKTPLKVTVTDDVTTCHAIRRVVFIDEQGVPEAEEIDGRDGAAVHFLVWQGDTAIGTARAFMIGEAIKIGRVAVLEAARGTGAGKALMRGVMDWARDAGLRVAKLDAQTAVIPFYEDLGFAAFGPEFDDAGIPHRRMERTL